MTRSVTSVRVLFCFLVGSFVSAGAFELPAQAFSNLASASFRVREEAQSELLEWGRTQAEPAKDELLKQSKTAPDPEVRERCLTILRELVTDDYSKEGNGYIGVGLKSEIAMVPDDPKPRGVIRVTQVQPDTPGQRAGILVGDLIVALDRDVWHEIDAQPVFMALIKAMKPNTKAKLKILRQGKLVDVIVTLVRRPLSADNPFLAPSGADPDGPERAAKEAYFRQWLSDRKPRE